MRYEVCAAAGSSVLLCALSFAGEELMLSDFESRESLRVIEARAKIELVSEHATQGKQAGKVPAGFTIVAGGWTRLPADWSGYDQLRLDIYNPGEVAKVSITIADAEGNDYWKRHNNSFPLRTGRNTIAIPVGGMWRGEKGSGKFLDTKDIKQLVISLPRKGAPAYYLDNFRLVRGAGKVEKRLLIGFEEGEKPGAKWNIEDWPPDAPGKSVATPVAEHATEGRMALKLQYRENGANITVRPLDPDWSGYDSLEIDCFNAAGAPIRISGWFRDEVSKTGEYWQRHNYQTNVLAGASTIRFPLGDPATGGSAEEGPRAIHVQWRDLAGNWSDPVVVDVWVVDPDGAPTIGDPA